MVSIPAGAEGQVWFSTRGETQETATSSDWSRPSPSAGSINFVATPLHEVADSLSRQFQVPIVASAKKLEEAGVNLDAPITKQLLNLPLEATLRHILDELELGLALRDGVILITTPEDIESPLDTRTYPATRPR